MVACVGLVGCGARTFVCETDAQCDDGMCEATGYCSFPDATCPGGRRYGSLAASHLAGECVGEPDDATGTTGDASLPATASSSSGSAGETTLALTSDAASTSSSTTMDRDSTSTGKETSSTSGPPDGVWIDDFERLDATEIGNDWIEKHPTTWALADGRVRAEGAPLNYEDNIVYRPEDEDLRDLSVSIEFQVLLSDANNHPQVLLRLQHADIETPGSVTGYILYVTEPNLSLTRQIAGAFDAQWQIPLASELVPGEQYQLTLTAIGEDTVELLGQLAILTDNGWMLHTEVAHDDVDPERISLPGTMGFSGADTEQIENIVYDNFTRTDLSP